MHPALSVLGALLVQFGRRLTFALVAIAAAVGIVVVTADTSTPANQRSLLAITISSSASATGVSSPRIRIIVETPSGAVPGSVRLTSSVHPSASASPHPTSASSTPTAALATTASNSSIAAPPVAAPAAGSATSPPAVISSTASAGPVSTFHYAGARDIAAIVNPQRLVQGWSPVTPVAAKRLAECVADANCGGQLGPCDEVPVGIGDAATTQVFDGQYKDQSGNCREVISWSP